MTPDEAIGEVEDDYKAGIIGIRLSLHDTENEGRINWQNYPNWAARLRKRPNIMKVRAYLFQARDLPAADDDGGSDPFVRITDCGKIQESRVIFGNINPIWYETLELGYECGDLIDCPPFILDVFDMDIALIGSNDCDFLSRAVLRIHDIAPFSEDSSVIVPTWFPLYYKKGGAMSGEILVSFAIVEDDYMFKYSEDKVNLPKEVGIIFREY